MLYKQSVDRLKEIITTQTPSLIAYLIEHSLKTFLHYSDLLAPIKALEKRSNVGVPEFIRHSTWTLGDNSNNYLKSYSGFERSLSISESRSNRE